MVVSIIHTTIWMHFFYKICPYTATWSFSIKIKAFFRGLSVCGGLQRVRRSNSPGSARGRDLQSTRRVCEELRWGHGEEALQTHSEQRELLCQDVRAAQPQSQQIRVNMLKKENIHSPSVESTVVHVSQSRVTLHTGLKTRDFLSSFRFVPDWKIEMLLNVSIFFSVKSKEGFKYIVTLIRV